MKEKNKMNTITQKSARELAIDIFNTKYPKGAETEIFIDTEEGNQVSIGDKEICPDLFHYAFEAKIATEEDIIKKITNNIIQAVKERS